MKFEHRAPGDHAANVTPKRDARDRLNQRQRRHCPSELGVEGVEHARPLRRVDDDVDLLVVARDEPAAEAGPVLGVSAVPLGPDDAAAVRHPREERGVVRPVRKDLPEQRSLGCEREHDLDAHPAQLRLGELQNRRALRHSSGRDEAQAEPLLVADVDAVGTRAAAGLLEQASCPRGGIAVAAPVRPVVALGGDEDRAVERAAVPRLRLGQQHARDLRAVDAERQRPTHEPVLQRRMPAGADTEDEVLHRRRRPRDDAPAGEPTHLTRPYPRDRNATPATRDTSISFRRNGPIGSFAALRSGRRSGRGMPCAVPSNERS